jgi:RNA polymerase sigma-70 factor (ECF subfamily)
VNEDGVEPSDAALIAASAGGQLDAFDRLMTRYERLVFRIAMTCTRNREAALDVSQDTFLKAYQRLGSLRNGDTFKGWIARIAYRESVNWLRAHRRDAGMLDVDQAAVVPDAAPSPEAAALAGEHGARIAEHLQALNPRHRLALTLRYFEGLSGAEIGAALGCSEAVVKSMLFRSLRRLREELMTMRHM